MRAAPWRWWLLLALLFAAVHACAWWAGVRFDRSTLNDMMHFLDPVLLRTQLLESVWYLHIQPPLMNLVTGLILKLTPEAAWLFHALFLAFGFTLYSAVFWLQVRLGIGHRLALVLATLFLASPAFLLYEHFLLYTLPSAALLVASALQLHRAQQSARPRAWAAFFVLLLVLCATRSLFHGLFFLLVWAGLALAIAPQRRRILLAGLVPALLLAGLYAKNYAIFGEASLSTLMPKNLWIMTVGNMRWEDKVALVESGELSPLALTNRWSSIDEYPPEYLAVPAHFAEIEALTQTHKSTGGANYNHYGLIAVGEVYGRDAAYVLRHEPKVYLISVALAAYRYFWPASIHPVAPYSRAAIAGYVDTFDAIAYGRWPFSLDSQGFLSQRGGGPPHLFLLLGLPLLVGYGALHFVRGGWPLSPERVVLGYMLFSIVCVAVLGCAFDFWETSRYRLMTDGFYLTLLGLALSAAMRRASRRYAAAPLHNTRQSSARPPQ